MVITTGSICGIIFFKRISTGDGDSRNSCYLKKIRSRFLIYMRPVSKVYACFSFIT